VLGVAPTAGPDEIRRRYRQLVKATHPDAVGAVTADGASPAQQPRQPEGTVELFLEIHRAYEVLRDPLTREAYDRARALARGTAAAEVSGGQGRWGRGALASFARAFLGELWQDGDPPYPAGDPLWNRSATAGTRRPGAQRQAPSPGGGRQAPGPVHRVALTLAECFAGAEAQVSGVRVRIPPGAREATRYRVPAPLWEIEVSVRPDPRYSVDGDDLATELDVSPVTAAAGGEASITHPAGPIVVKLPQGLRNGQVLRLRGQGLPATATRRAGDLLIRIRLASV